MGISRDLVVARERIATIDIDIGGRDIVVGIGEPSLRSPRKHPEIQLLSLLNARLGAYVLPAIEIAKKQAKRPRLMLVSGINFALRWNAKNEYERAIMLINNQLKIDYLNAFIRHFAPEAFSLTETVISQDLLKIPEHKLLALWALFERRYPTEAADARDDLVRFARVADEDDDSLQRAIAYAVAHLFAAGDINFEGNYAHNKIGYASIGGDREKTFNKIRGMLMPLVQDFSDIIFDRSTVVKDNMRIIVETVEQVPPPYNGYFKESGAGHLDLSEVTFENERSLEFYETHRHLHEDIEYIYRLCGKESYTAFWTDYRARYLDFKSRYQEAYGVSFPAERQKS